MRDLQAPRVVCGDGGVAIGDSGSYPNTIAV